MHEESTKKSSHGRNWGGGELLTCSVVRFVVVVESEDH
jgi:hypothetical protein